MNDFLDFMELWLFFPMGYGNFHLILAAMCGGMFGCGLALLVCRKEVTKL